MSGEGKVPYDDAVETGVSAACIKVEGLTSRLTPEKNQLLCNFHATHAPPRINNQFWIFHLQQ
jgi:hypothetical protein